MSYEFGSFKFLLRFEVDCVESEEDNTVDNLLESMAGVSFRQKDVENATKFKNSNLSFIDSGKFQPNEKIIELTTKSKYKGVFEFPKFKWNQLFFSQTDYLVIGWHTCGQLKKIEKLKFSEVTNRCGRTPDSIRKSTNKLHSLLQELNRFLRNVSEEKDRRIVYSLVFFKESNEQSLKIYKCEGHSGSLPIEFAKTLELVF